MGFNSVIFVLNDAADAIFDKNKDEFCAEMLRQVGGRGARYTEPHSRNGEEVVGLIPDTFPVGSYCNYVSLVTDHHADMTSLILAGGNYCTVLGTALGHEHHTKKSVKRMLNDILDQYGLKVVEKRKS